MHSKPMPFRHHRFSGPRRSPDRFTLQIGHHDRSRVYSAWCARPASNRHRSAYEAPALPIELQARMVKVAGFEPAASCSRSRRSSGLSYTLIVNGRGDLLVVMAPCTGLEPVSPDRQSSRLTRCVTGPELVRPAGVEPTWLPAPLSRWCVYRFRHERGKVARNGWRTRWDSNPRSFCAGLRDRALCRSGHWSAMEDPGGFEPLEDGLKGRSLSIRV